MFSSALFSQFCSHNGFTKSCCSPTVLVVLNKNIPLNVSNMYSCVLLQQLLQFFVVVLLLFVQIGYLRTVHEQMYVVTFLNTLNYFQIKPKCHVVNVSHGQVGSSMPTYQNTLVPAELQRFNRLDFLCFLYVQKSYSSVSCD